MLNSAGQKVMDSFSYLTNHFNLYVIWLEEHYRRTESKSLSVHAHWYRSL